MNIFGKKKRIFLDFAGGEKNPSGIHKEGMEARKILEDERQKMAQILKCQTRDIIFTSGGTESDNLAVLGVFESARENPPAGGKNPHIIISDSEHPAIYESAKEAERRGAELSILPVEKIIENIKENTVLVSVIYGNNQTGAINPVPKLVRLIKDHRRKNQTKFPYFHTDASAAYEFLEVDINKVQADLITLEKVLVVRPNVEIRPIIFGGGQERGLRSGTENVEAITHFVKQYQESVENREKEFARMNELRKFFIEELEKNVPRAKLNETKENLPNIVSITVQGALHEFLAIKLDERGVAVSTGSSCDSRKSEKDKEALRFSFGRNTSKSEIKEAIRVLAQIVI